MEKKNQTITCCSLGQAHMKIMNWFQDDPTVHILFIIRDNRPDEQYYYVTDSPGHIRRFETCTEVLRPAKPVTISAARPLIKAICDKHGLTWRHDAPRIIKLVNQAIKDVGYIAEHMITRSGDNSEYLPNLVDYYTPRYIANCIHKN